MMTELGVYQQSIARDYNTWLIVAGAFVILLLSVAIVLYLLTPMIAQRSLLFGLMATVLIIAAIWWDPYYLVDLGGHGTIIGYGVWVLLVGLATTHVALLLIMWVQRHHWHSSESAMFRFTWMKAIFWWTTVYFFRPVDRGQPLINMLLFVLLFLTTIDLDVRLVRRYILDDES